MARHLEACALKDPSYSSLHTVTRSIHFGDYNNVFLEGKLIPRPFRSKVRSSYSIGPVLWFGPSRSSLNDHNWYGNVSFQISMNQLCYKFGTNFFYIDKQELSTHTATRLVLASSETLNGFNRVDLHEVGSPLQFEWGSWKYVSQCESAYGLLPHELEIGIQADEEECKWLYQNCSVEGNDHSDVNKFDICRFEPHKCHRYNTFSKTCPFPLNKTAADEKLKTYRSETVKLFSNLL